MAIGTLTINLRFSVEDLLTRFARYEFRDHEEGSFRLPSQPPTGAVAAGAMVDNHNDTGDILMDLKQGLMHASERHGFEGEGFSYLRSPIWWAGVIMRTEPSPSHLKGISAGC